MLVKFSPEFKKYVSFKEAVVVDGATLSQCLEKLLCDYPQLYVFLVADAGEESNKTSLKLNNEYLLYSDCLWQKVSSEDVLEFGRDVPEGSGGIGKIIVGVVLIAAAFLSAGSLSWAALGFWGKMAVMAGVSMTMGGMSELVMGQPQLPTYDSGNSSSATYSFSGIKNTTTPGTPVNIIYGKHRVGGHVLNAFVDVLGVDQFLYAQYGLSEGEIDSIDVNSVQVNNQSILHYQDIAAFWRTGSNVNEPQWPLITPKETTSLYDTSASPIKLARVSDTLAECILLNSEDITGISLKFNLKIALYASDMYKGDSETTPSPLPELQSRIEVYSGDTLLGATDNPVSFNNGNWGLRILPFILQKDFNFNTLSTDLKVKFYFYTELGQGVWDGWETLRHYLVIDGYTLKTTTLDTLDNRNSMYGFNRIENSVTHNILAAKPAPPNEDTKDMGAVATTSKPVHACKVIISAPALYSNGGAARVDFKIFYKIKDAPSDSWVEYTAPNNYPDWNYITSPASKSEVSVSRELVFPALDQYDICVLRTTNNHDADLNIGDTIYLKNLDEIVYSDVAYVNTALLGVRIKATDQISGNMPVITSVVSGVKVAVPEGTNGSDYNGTDRYMPGGVANWSGQLSATKAWTDNPVWCLWDLITNTRYGAGNYFTIDQTKLGLMLANFYVMAEYCDTRIKDDGTIVTDPASAEWAAARPRFSLNIVLDESKSIPELLTAICGVMRASWYYSEGIVWIDIDRKKNITQLFNMSNIKDFTQTGLSYRGMINSYEAQFINKEKDYEKDILLIEAESLNTNSQLEERKKTLDLVGVTDYRQAQALARYALLAGENLLTSVSFKTGTYGLLSTIGDVVGIQHDVPAWGYGGKIEGYNAGTLELTLSGDVIYSGNAMSIMISSNGAEPVTLALTAKANGTYNTVTLTGTPATAPAIGDDYVVGETTNVVKPFKVLAVKRDSDELVEISCVEYNESIYDLADDITGAGTFVTYDYSTLPDPVQLSVSNFTVEERAYTDSAGNVKVGVDCYYSVPTALNWAGVIINYGTAGSGIYTQLPVDKSGYVFIPDIGTAGTLQFIACSVYKDNTRQTINESLVDLINNPFTTLVVSSTLANNITLSGVSGLQLKGQGNDNVFVGRDAAFTWRKPQLVDALTNLPAGEDGGAGVNDSSSWLKHYLIEILNQSGSVRRNDKITVEEYTYNHIDNHADGITRYFSIRITPVDKLGRRSAPVTLSVSNPAPAAIS